MEIPYDSLIVAAGGRTSYFGNDQFERFAPGMKTIDDALELRRRIFGAFELAELEDDPEEKRRWLTFVVVGAGPTGCELAGQIRELAERSLRHNFRTIDPTTAKVLLIDGGKEPLATFGENLSGKGRKELEHMGVELRMGLRATNIDLDGIDVKTQDGTDRIHAHTVIWAAGVAASPLAKHAGRRVGRRGRPRRPGGGTPRLHAARPPRGVRHRRHDEPRPPSRASPKSRCNKASSRVGRFAAGSKWRRPDGAVQVRRPRQHGHDRTVPRRGRVQAHPPQRLRRMARCGSQYT